MNPITINKVKVKVIKMLEIQIMLLRKGQNKKVNLYILKRKLRLFKPY